MRCYQHLGLPCTQCLHVFGVNGKQQGCDWISPTSSESVVRSQPCANGSGNNTKEIRRLASLSI